MKKIEIKIDCRSKDFTLKQNLRKEIRHKPLRLGCQSVGLDYRI